MAWFLALPPSLASAVLNKWVGPQENLSCVSALDIAFCKGMAWIRFLRTVSIQNEIYSIAMHGDSVCSFYRWVIARQCPLESVLFPDVVSDVVKLSYGKRLLRAAHLSYETDKKIVHAKDITSYLELLPSVTSISFGRSCHLPNVVLASITDEVGSRLLQVSVSGPSALILAVLDSVGTKCPNLQTLTIRMGDLQRSDWGPVRRGILKLCAKMRFQLTDLHLLDFPFFFAYTDCGRFVRQISSTLRHLLSFSILGTSSKPTTNLTEDGFHAILVEHPNMFSCNLNDQCRYFRLPSGNCTMRWLYFNKDNSCLLLQKMAKWAVPLVSVELIHAGESGWLQLGLAATASFVTAFGRCLEVHRRSLQMVSHSNHAHKKNSFRIQRRRDRTIALVFTEPDHATAPVLFDLASSSSVLGSIAAVKWISSSAVSDSLMQSSFGDFLALHGGTIKYVGLATSSTSHDSVTRTDFLFSTMAAACPALLEIYADDGNLHLSPCKDGTYSLKILRGDSEAVARSATSRVVGMINGSSVEAGDGGGRCLGNSWSSVRSCGSAASCSNSPVGTSSPFSRFSLSSSSSSNYSDSVRFARSLLPVVPRIAITCVTLDTSESTKSAINVLPPSVWTHLQHLIVLNAVDKDDEWFAQFLSRCPRLQSLTWRCLGSEEKVDSEVLVSLVLSCKELTELRLVGNIRIQKFGLKLLHKVLTKCRVVRDQQPSNGGLYV